MGSNGKYEGGKQTKGENGRGGKGKTKGKGSKVPIPSILI